MRYCIHISEHNPQTETLVGGPYASMDLCNSNCIPFSDLYIVNLIDEADPNYSASLNGFSFGDLWPKDVVLLDTALENASFNNYFISVFDIGNRTQQNGKEVLPSVAIITNNITNSPCYLPIPISNIIPTTRPGRYDRASQRTLKTDMSSALQAKYGSFSSILDNKPNPDTIPTFIFIVDDSGSMTYDQTVRYAFEDSDGIDGLVKTITGFGLRCIVLASCASERWLQWTATVLNNVSSLIDDYDSAANRSIQFIETQFTFCEGCETIEFMYQKENGDYTPLVELSINGKIGSGSEQLGDAVFLTWEIDNAFVQDFVFATNKDIENLEEQIVEYNIQDNTNNQFAEVKNVKVYLYCNNGMFYLNIDSTFNYGVYNYTWKYIEVPVNALGLPDGTVSLSRPTTDDTQEDVYYTDSSGGLEVERPIIPTITFTYVGLGTTPVNECAQYDVTTTTTTTTTAP